jgi:hypothetical protein
MRVALSIRSAYAPHPFFLCQNGAVSGLDQTVFLLSADHQTEKKAKQAYKLNVGIRKAD